MSESNVKIVWIVQLDKEMREFFDLLAAQEGDKTYGAGSRYVKRVLYDFMHDHQDVKKE